MANEADVRISLNIRKSANNIDFRSNPTQFRANVDGAKGPTPGALTISTSGEDVSFAELTTPGLCFFHNQDPTNYVSLGIWDGVEFLPLFELMPGEFYVMRISRFLGTSFGAVPGTGSTDSGNTLRLKAHTAPCVVVVGAFEK